MVARQSTASSNQSRAPRRPLTHAQIPVKRCGQPGCVIAGEHQGRHIFEVRPGRAAETSIRVIGASMPDDAAGLAKRPTQWLAEVEAALAGFQIRGRELRADFRLTVVRIARGLASSVQNWRRAVARPTWDHLAMMCGRDRRTVARALKWLRERGLLSVVATGRSAAYSKSEGGDAAVYALWTRGDNANFAGKEINVTPTPPKGEYKPTCAREERCYPTESLRDADSLGESPASRLARLRRKVFAGASLAANAGLVQAFEPLGEKKAKKMERLERAEQLQRLVPALRAASVPSIAAELRQYIEAGWTDGDIRHAIDWQQSGVRWPHSADWLIARPDLWLKYRLKDWIGDNGPVESVSQSKARLAQANARAAEAKRRAETAHQAQLQSEQQARATLWGVDTNGAPLSAAEAGYLRLKGHTQPTAEAFAELEKYRAERRRIKFFSSRK